MTSPRRKDPHPPPPRSMGINVRFRPEEYHALVQAAWGKKLLLSEWARGVLLRELEGGNAK